MSQSDEEIIVSGSFTVINDSTLYEKVGAEDYLSGLAGHG